jgi:hypothetical protein
MNKLRVIARCCDGSCTVDELEYLYDHDREIKYSTFARHVDIPFISDYLGYIHGSHKQQGLRLKKDWHVRFYSSKFRGKRCYHLDWSQIDHIFQN